MATKTLALGTQVFKKFQPCPCDVCKNYRPAHLCTYIPEVGIICDQCQVKLSQDTNHENAALVKETGAAGIAVITAISREADPREAAIKLKKIFL